MIRMGVSGMTDEKQERSGSTTVLIIDDHPSFLAAARMLLEREGFVVVGEALDGHDAVTAAAQLAPDVVLLDVQLPDIDGFEVARRLAELPSPPVVVLTSSREAANYGTRVAAAAVQGFIAKHELSGERLAGVVAGGL